VLIDKLHEAKILIVDDDASNMRLLEDVLRVEGYTHIKTTDDPRGVLAYIIETHPDLIILDLNMPHLSGFQLLDLMKPLVGETDYLPVLVVSAESSFEARRQALTNGASDFLVKPFIAAEVAVRITNMLRLRFINLTLKNQNYSLEEEVLHRTVELEGYQIELKEAQLEVIARLARAAEYRDDQTGKHTQRVGLISTLLAQTMGLPNQHVEMLMRSAPLHDVGKIGVPDSVLLKPGFFTETERLIMQRHCVVGAELLTGGQSDIVKMAERIALTHHERWDGAGYPLGLKQVDIPVEARILAVADVFDALTHERPYKPAWTVDKALAELRDYSGRQFDPQVVEAFMTLPYQDLI